jgi:DNA-cytosine methyltransferase
MKILSLFDGMSVAQQALKNIGADVELYYASEIDEYAKAVTQANHPKTVQLGSVTEVNTTNFYTKSAVELLGHEIDLLIGGSPCQDLSIAKKDRKGLDGERSGLFYEYVRIRDEVKPKYFVLENVASMAKEAKDTISEVLGVEPVMINASLVSAQNRKRLFWVGKLVGDKYEQVEIPQPEDMGILLKDILESDVDEKYFVSEKHTRAMINTRKSKKLNIPELDGKTGTLTASYYKIPNDGIYIPQRIGSLNSGGQGDRIYSQDGKSVALSANGGGRGAKTGLYAVPVALPNRGEGKKPEYNGTDKANAMTSVQTDSMVAIIPEATKKGYAIAQDGDSIDMSFPDSKTRRGRVGNKVKNLMTSQNIGVFTQGAIRKLTPTECLRLQSMPDDYFDKAEYKGKPISNTQRYKMCGNAFNCKVIEHILKTIL